MIGHHRVLTLIFLMMSRVHIKAVNDVDAKRALQQTLEKNFNHYASDRALLAAGTVRPSAESEWKSTVQSLRDEIPGHFWAPVWPR